MHCFLGFVYAREFYKTSNEKDQSIAAITLLKNCYKSYVMIYTSNYICGYKHSNKKLMNKGNLIDKVASEAKITKVQANAAIDAFLSSTTTALKKGERVVLVGFGTFMVTKRAARKGRNPQTGKVINIAARKVVRFRTGVELSKKVK